MYRIRRVYKTKPREAGNVAKLVYQQAKLYRDAGYRGEMSGVLTFKHSFIDCCFAEIWTARQYRRW